GRTAQDLPFARTQIELDDRGRLGRCRGREDKTRAVTLERRRRIARVGKVERLEPSAFRVEQLETVDRGPGEDAGNATVREEGIAREIEDPLRIAELRLLSSQRVHLAVALDVQVRPASPIRHEMEKPVAAPLGLEDRLLLRAGHPAAVRDRPVRVEFYDTEIRALERHVRVIPGDPRQKLAVRARTGSGVEIASGRDDLRVR